MNINVYDFDKTIYAGDSTLDFYIFCIRRNPALLRFLPFQMYGLFAYKINKISKKRFKEYFFRFLHGIDDVDSLVKMFWDTQINRICNWYKEISSENDFIISASPDFLLNDICQRLNVNIICSNVDKHTGIFDGENCYGEEKVNRLYEFCGKDVIIDSFYSDSISDLPLAMISKNSYLVKNNIPTEWIVDAQDVQNEHTNSSNLNDNITEVIRYLVFGGLTFLLSVVSYSAFIDFFSFRPIIANIISWILAVLFAYYTNKRWVFRQASNNGKTKQLVGFLIVRIITLLIEEMLLWIFVEQLMYPNLIVKIITQIIVIVLNYVFSKYLVFK